MPVDEISLGDYVLAGGEAAVLVIVEAVARLLPGVLGNAESADDDSFAAGPDGLLEAPAYTRPASWRGLDVPPVLLSGNHARDRAVARASALANAPASAGPTCSDERDATAAMPCACGIIVGLPARPSAPAGRGGPPTILAAHPIRRAAGC